MNVVIFCGGIGAHLKEETEFKPKPMVEIGDRLGDRNNLNFNSHIPERGWNITLADTGYDALKGARLKRVEKYVAGDTFMVTCGDGVASIDINDLLYFHKSHGL